MNVRITFTPIVEPDIPTPTAPPSQVSLCKHCDEWADCQTIATVEGYAELAGDYCAECLTQALIYLAQESNAYHLTAEDHRDLLLQLLTARGEQGITDEEGRALEKWAHSVTHMYAMLQLALSGDAFVADFRNGQPYFAVGPDIPDFALPTENSNDHP